MVAVLRSGRSISDSLASAVDPHLWLENSALFNSEEDRALIQKAFDFAKQAYGQRVIERTQEPLFSHAVAAAAIVADLNLLPDAIAATLLMHVLQPCLAPKPEATLLRLSTEYNANIAELVSGHHKVQQLTELTRQEKPAHLGVPSKDNLAQEAQQAEVLRKMLLAMVSDIRVVLIALASQTQTMHFLTNVTDDTIRHEIGCETLNLFAPLANRLGVWQIKWELEDLGFRHTEAQAYKHIAKLLDGRRLERLAYIEQTLQTLRLALQAEGINADVAGRPKHIYSIWKKMQKKKLQFTELYDIRAVRILVEKDSDCYTALGIIHSLWQPISGEFDDYISHPKPNNYRSLHTAVIGPEDKAIEVQIRTVAMHEYAEFGVAAHWRYKEGGEGNAAYEEKIAWLRQLLDWREDMASTESPSQAGKANDLAAAFKTELFSDVIYVLTPAGKVIALSSGATPIDFAYAVHTDLGHRCRGAKIEGRIVPLSTPLKSGQRIEILTSKELKPSVNWLHEGWVKTHRAVSKIRQFIRQQNGEVAKETGQLLLEKALGKYPKISATLLVEKMGYSQLDDLHKALGQGELSLRQVQHVIEQLLPEPSAESLLKEVIRRPKSLPKKPLGSVLVEGQAGVLTALAKCCKPAPPDEIDGFVTKGRGISVHRSSCLSYKQMAEQSPARRISVAWTLDEAGIFPIEIEVFALDRPHLIRDLSDTLTREKARVIGINKVARETRVQLRFTIEVKQVDNLGQILTHLVECKGVTHALRV